VSASARVHLVTGARSHRDREAQESEPAIAGERLEEIAWRYYGNPSLWRALARLNGIDNPLQLPAGRLIRIPPLSLLEAL
jgi:hypothetical protein